MLEKMLKVIEENRKELDRIFQKEGVVLAYLFGSQARGTTSPMSDIDIAVLFSDEIPREEQFHKKLAIGSKLDTIFHINTDIVGLNTAPPLLKHRAVLYGTLIFAQDKSLQRTFQLRVLQEYEDFAYHLKKSYEIINKHTRQRVLGKPLISSLTSKYLKRYVTS